MTPSSVKDNISVRVIYFYLILFSFYLFIFIIYLFYIYICLCCRFARAGNEIILLVLWRKIAAAGADRAGREAKAINFHTFSRLLDRPARRPPER